MVFPRSLCTLSPALRTIIVAHRSRPAFRVRLSAAERAPNAPSPVPNNAMSHRRAEAPSPPARPYGLLLPLPLRLPARPSIWAQSTSRLRLHSSPVPTAQTPLKTARYVSSPRLPSPPRAPRLSPPLIPPRRGTLRSAAAPLAQIFHVCASAGPWAATSPRARSTFVWPTRRGARDNHRPRPHMPYAAASPSVPTSPALRSPQGHGGEHLAICHSPLA